MGELRLIISLTNTTPSTGCFRHTSRTRASEAADSVVTRMATAAITGGTLIDV